MDPSKSLTSLVTHLQDLAQGPLALPTSNPCITYGLDHTLPLGLLSGVEAHSQWLFVTYTSRAIHSEQVSDRRIPGICNPEMGGAVTLIWVSLRENFLEEVALRTQPGPLTTVTHCPRAAPLLTAEAGLRESEPTPAYLLTCCAVVLEILSLFVTHAEGQGNSFSAQTLMPFLPGGGFMLSVPPQPP